MKGTCYLLAEGSVGTPLSEDVAVGNAFLARKQE